MPRTKQLKRATEPSGSRKGARSRSVDVTAEIIVLSGLVVAAAVGLRILASRSGNALNPTPAPVVNEQARAELSALYWQIQNGELPAVPVPIALQRNEICHFSCAASWYEPRVQTTRVDYAGAGYRIRIAKGLHFRVGSVAGKPVKKDVLTLLDSGTVYLTNRRVIFDGEKANKTIKVSNLIGFEPYSDAIALEKATGKNPVIMLQGNAELAALVLAEVLARA